MCAFCRRHRTGTVGEGYVAWGEEEVELLPPKHNIETSNAHRGKYYFYRYRPRPTFRYRRRRRQDYIYISFRNGFFIDLISFFLLPTSRARVCVYTLTVV